MWYNCLNYVIDTLLQSKIKYKKQGQRYVWIFKYMNYYQKSFSYCYYSSLSTAVQFFIREYGCIIQRMVQPFSVLILYKLHVFQHVDSQAFPFLLFFRTAILCNILRPINLKQHLIIGFIDFNKPECFIIAISFFFS